MLETDEVDIDYFTPAGGTSLANIFGKNSVADETKETPSLKYVPPPPPEKSKPEEVKPTQWILTCVVHGFEWINSGYTSRGKLGLAILKVVKTNNHSIILYDSNKITVSYVTISSKLNIHIRDILTISYYDNAQKYWSIRTSDDNLNKILELLKELQATVVHKSTQDSNIELSAASKVHSKDDVTINKEEHKEEQEIDTDFYINQKTKDSILKRMANMGQSVLPTHISPKGHTSDSTDSNDIDNVKKTIRHKPVKVFPKRHTDFSVKENEGNIEACHSRKVTQDINMDEPAVVSSKRPTVSPYGSDMNIFISEQKISNSELRINVNRVSDKLDVVCERLNDVISINKSNSFSNFQNDIVQKLIREYENKIKNYEYIMSSKGIDFQTMATPGKPNFIENVSDDCKDNVQNINEISRLEKDCIEKDHIIRELENKICVLNERVVKINNDHEKKINELEMEIKTLNKNLHLKYEEINSVRNNSNCIKASNQENCDISSKVKKIMNDTYEAISVNFDDKEAYSGEKVKTMIALVIKKTTIQALQEL